MKVLVVLVLNLKVSEVGSAFSHVFVSLLSLSSSYYIGNLSLSSGRELSPVDLKNPLYVVNFSPVHLQWYWLCIILGKIGKIVIFCSVVQMRNPH